MVKNKRENFIIFLCFAVYTVSYLGRYSYTSNISLLIDYFAISHADAGLVTTCFFFAYGIGQSLNAVLIKRYNQRYIISFVLISSGVINLLVFFGIPFPAIKYLWLINGLLQSCLWSSLIIVLSQNLQTERLKPVVVIMSSSIAAGTLLSYALSSLFSLCTSFFDSFFSAALAMMVVGTVWFLFFPKLNRPQAPKEAAPEDALCDARRSQRQSLFVILILLGVFAVLTNLVKDGLMSWVPSIIKDTYNLSDSLSISLTLILPFAGLFGTYFAVRLNKCIKDFVSLSGVLFLLSAICIFAVLFLLTRPCWQITVLFMGIISLLMHGVNNMITAMVPLYYRENVDSGRVAGLLNGCCYVGSTISSYCLGVVVDHTAWINVLQLLFMLCLAPVLIALIRKCFYRTTH